MSGLRFGRQGSRDKLILRTGIYAPVSLRWYLSVRAPFTNFRFRRFKRLAGA